MPIHAARTSFDGNARAPLDERFEQLIEERFDRLMRTNPVWATLLGIHEYDHELGDANRDAIEQEIADERRFVSAVESLDASGLSDAIRFEREVALHSARRTLFDLDVQRVWERRGTAMDQIGDGLFALFARDFAPLPERLDAMASRLEQAPRIMEENRARVDGSPVRLWQELELQAAQDLPSLIDEILAAGRTAQAEGSKQARLEAAADGTREALARYGDWLRESLARGNDEFPIGREHYDELVALRAFDGLTADEILEVGEQQLAANKEARRQVALEIDPNESVDEVLDRIKSEHPTTFEDALDEYRGAMFRARQHILDRDLATLPPGETLSVMPTPEYMRNVIPFAAYFEPPRFDEHPSGIYIVTPSVDGSDRAMREHSYASISNTSIHEAYPGHHLQLSAAITHPSLVRLTLDAPEFIEGWGMYSEQMMREQGFDDAPKYRLYMYTDAIWRAARIILDVRLHRREIGVAEAIDFLARETGFERPNATAEVHRYTYTPTYQLSYLLGKVLLLRLREDEQRRLGGRFSLKSFHDALLYAGNLPISFHRRVLAGEGGGAGGVTKGSPPLDDEAAGDRGSTLGSAS